VTLLLDGKLLATKDAVIPANGRASVEFTGFNVPYGTHRAQIRLEGSDGLPDDNVLPFSMERSDTRPVLFLSNGHGRDSFYYRTALEAAQNTGLSVQVVNAPQWEGEDFARYPFVVVSDVGVLPPGLDQRLSTFVRRGGSLLLLAGPAMARHGRTPVGGLPVELSTVTQAAAHVDNTYRPLNDVGSFDNVQFFVTARLGNASNARVTAKLSDGSPLLVEQTIGEGRVLTFASTFDNATSDLPLHKSFIPFVAATARYLARLEDVSADVVTGAPVQVRRSNENGAAVDVIGPDGAHELSLREAAQAQYFVPRRSGFYELHRADGGRFLLAAHADPLESDLSRTPDETLTIWRNTGSVTNSTPGRAAETTSYQQTYWQWILLFALGCALAESIFASRYLSPERKAHDSSRSTERVFAKT
jgi:hypothetical protein